MHSEKSSLVLIFDVWVYGMSEVLWLLEHVRLRVDPLKDAAGSPFGKADRLYLYLHFVNICTHT